MAIDDTLCAIEQVIIYQRCHELLIHSNALLKRLPTSYGFLGDQIRRASASVLQNFAEGYGKSTQKDARRFFSISRGSCNEVAAIFDIAHTAEIIDTKTHQAAKECADHLARMLSKFNIY